ncbi:MAG: glycine cleavage system protein H [Pirellulales bacterium]
MTKPLVFMMGQAPAILPTDRQYSKNHMWAQARGDGFRFGFSAYAVRLLQDVYFLDWSADAGATLAQGQVIGAIESSKAESDLYAPIGGVLTELNQDLLTDPSAINVDPYSAGWLLAIQGPGDTLLTPEEYLLHVEKSWKIAQKKIRE